MKMIKASILAILSEITSRISEQNFFRVFPKVIQLEVDRIGESCIEGNTMNSKILIALVTATLVLTPNARAANKANKYAGLNGVYSGTLNLESEFGCEPVSASSLTIKHKVTVKKTGFVTILDKDPTTGQTVLMLNGFVTTGSKKNFSAVKQEESDGCTYSTVVQYQVGKKNAAVTVDQSTTCDAIDYSCTASYSGTLKRKASKK